MENQNLLTVEQTAKILNVKASWVRSAVFRRAIPYVKVGHLVRFRERDLKEWIKENVKEVCR